MRMVLKMAADSKVTIIMLGESSVGKTSLLNRFVKRIFKKFQNTSIDVLYKDIVVMDRNITLELWDTAGSERFKAIVKQYFRKADGVVLVYDVTNVTTFHKLSSWLSELRDYNEEAIVIIVGNKNDDADVKSVSKNIVRSYADQENLEYFEASAKEGENVDEIFEHLTKRILQSRETGSSPQISEDNANNECDGSALEDSCALVDSYSVVKFLTNTSDSSVIGSQRDSNATSCSQNGGSLPPIVRITESDIITLCIEKEEKKRRCC